MFRNVFRFPEHVCSGIFSVSETFSGIFLVSGMCSVIILASRKCSGIFPVSGTISSFQNVPEYVLEMENGIPVSVPIFPDHSISITATLIRNIGIPSHSIQSDLENASRSININPNMPLGNEEIDSCDDG